MGFIGTFQLKGTFFLNCEQNLVLLYDKCVKYLCKRQLGNFWRIRVTFFQSGGYLCDIWRDL